MPDMGDPPWEVGRPFVLNLGEYARKNREEMRSLLDKLGLQNFDYEKEGYSIGNNPPWSINKKDFELAFIHKKNPRQGYRNSHINIIYKIKSSPYNEPTILRQVELARELATKLRGYGCKQLIETPPRDIVISRLEEISKYAEEITKKFKS